MGRREPGRHRGADGAPGDPRHARRAVADVSTTTRSARTRRALVPARRRARASRSFEGALATNLDRGLFYADPIATQPRAARARVRRSASSSTSAPHALAGMRYDRYDADRDADRAHGIDARRRRTRCTRRGVHGGARDGTTRLLVEYDHSATRSAATTRRAGDARRRPRHGARAGGVLMRALRARVAARRLRTARVEPDPGSARRCTSPARSSARARFRRRPAAPRRVALQTLHARRSIGEDPRAAARRCSSRRRTRRDRRHRRRSTARGSCRPARRISTRPARRPCTRRSASPMASQPGHVHARLAASRRRRPHRARRHDRVVAIDAPPPDGELVVGLHWDGAADLDLHVVDPDGDEAWSGDPNTWQRPPPGSEPTRSADL